MAALRITASPDRRLIARHLAFAGAVFVASTLATAAQAQAPQAEPAARVIVTGEGSVSVAPDSAQIGCGVTTKATTAKEATDANSKQMAAVIAVLGHAGIEQKDIQTAQFSVQSVYAPPQPNAEPKLTGFSVTNRLNVTIRRIADVGDILDRLIAAGATDVGNVAFLHADASKALDQARAAAVADAKRKAELYARAAGVSLGGVDWIAEDSGYAPPGPIGALRASAAMAAVPIAAGEDTLRVRITVGFDLAHSSP